MGETIRDVIIVATIKVKGDEALQKVNEQARKWNGELEKAKRNEQAVTNEQKKLTRETEKTRRAQVGLDEALGKVKRAITQASEAYIKGNASAGRGLDILIRKEKELIRQLKRRESAIQKARISQSQRPGILGRARAGIGAAGGRVSALRSAAVVAAPVVIVAIAGTAANAIASASDKIRLQEKELGIEFTRSAAIGQAVADALQIPLDKIFREGGLFGAPEKEVKPRLRDRLIEARKRELDLINQQIQAVDIRYRKEIENQRKLADVQKQAAKEEEQRIKSIGGSLAQFSSLEQKSILGSLQRFQKGGSEGLTTEELERLQKLSFGREFFESQAASKVDPGLINQINQIVGAGRRAEVQKVILELKKGINVDVNIKLEGLENVKEIVEKAVVDAMKDGVKEALVNARVAVKNAQALMQNNHNAIGQ